ncbi:PEP-CTERM sorting domain-containing protein [Calothrix sp. CCY 0018]|uniref:PEP-CTERM sorting domain-containing protein n=1 Tax=Calothrix sp. CCY 0018 TaxID=3103864 RepID=UPI0039C6A1B3
MSVTTILKRLSIATVGATTIALTTVSAASAASIGFDFSGNGGQKESFNQSKNGLNVTATGKVANGTSRDVFQDEDGFGVFRGVGENPQIDGVGVNKRETLNLRFNKLVNLLSATFAKVDSDDEFKLFVDETQLVSDTQIPNSGTFDFTSFNATGTVLGFTVGDSDDDYFLKSVEVKEVPEPTTILGSLLVSGFGAMFYKKRKNQSDIAA